MKKALTNDTDKCRDFDTMREEKHSLFPQVIGLIRHV